MNILLTNISVIYRSNIFRSSIDFAYSKLVSKERWNYDSVHTYETIDLLYLYAVYALKIHRYYYSELTENSHYITLTEFVSTFENSSNEEINSIFDLKIPEAIKELLYFSASSATTVEAHKENEVDIFLFSIYSGLKPGNFNNNNGYLTWQQRGNHWQFARYNFDTRYSQYVQDNCRYYLLPVEGTLDEYYPVLKEQFHSITLAEDKVAFSHFSPEVIKAFSTIIDFSQIKTNLFPSYHHSNCNIEFRKTLHITFGTSPLPIQNYQFAGSIVGDTFLSENCINSFANKNDLVTVYTLESPFRGTPSVSKVTVKKRLLNSIIYIMPVITSINIFNFVTGQECSVPFVRLKINTNEKKIVKYKSSLNWITSFVRQLTTFNGIEFYNPEEYRKILERRFGNSTKYSKNVSNILNAYANSILEYQDSSFVAVTSTIDPDAFKYHEVASTAVDIPNLSENIKNERMLDRLTEQLTQFKDSLSSKQKELNSKNSSIESTREEIEYHKRRLENLIKDKENLMLAIPTIEKEILDFDKNIEALKEVIQPLSVKVKEFNLLKHESILQSVDNTDLKFLNNLSSSNMKLNHVYYTIPFLWHCSKKTSDYEKYFKLPIKKLSSDLIGCSGFRQEPMFSIESLPKMAYYAQNKISLEIEEVLTEEGVRELQFDSIEAIRFMLTPILISVDFSTLKPSIIKIDGSEKSVVGGPYNVILYSSISYNYTQCSIASFVTYMYLSAKESSTVLGIDVDYNDSSSVKIKLHPHTSGLYLPKGESFFTSLKDKYDYCCLGEAMPGIYKSFESGNVRMALFSAKTWIESANSTDPWGRTYGMFPTLNDVTLNGVATHTENELAQETQPSSQEEITDTEMLIILQGVIDNINTTLVANPVEEPSVVTNTSQSQTLQYSEEALVEQISEQVLTPTPTLPYIVPTVEPISPSPLPSTTRYSTYSSVTNIVPA